MKSINKTWFVAACLTAAAGCAAEPITGEAAREISTTGDTDLAVDCTGVLTFANTGSYAALDAALPSNVAQAIVNRRNTTPFVSIADLSSVSGVSTARLFTIGEAARSNGFITATCAGVYEELAVSADDRTAMLSFVNTAATEAVIDSLRASNAEALGPTIVAARPFTSLQQLASVAGVGPASFRGIRDAGVVGPFDILATAANNTPAEVWIRTGFDPIEALYPAVYGRSSQPICFGMPSDIVAQAGGIERPNLADETEVYNRVAGAIASAGTLPINPAAGLADLADHLEGQEFYGCSLSYEPNPWCGLSRSFFVNTVTGWRVFVETGWCE